MISLLSFLGFGGLLHSPAIVRDTAWVDKRAAEIMPTAAEKLIDTIGWVKDIRTALDLGKSHGRPIFLFTHDGRMGHGRC